MAQCLDPRGNAYRFVVLIFNCLLTFGSYFCFDMPSVLQGRFQGNYSCNSNDTENFTLLSNNSTCCTDCLGMTADEYNLLYAIYAWTNAIVVIGAGFLVDKFGNNVGLFLFSFLCVLGSSVFALGTIFRGGPAILPLMLIGRLLFGAGNGSLTIVQNRITAFWFQGKELAMAFGITLAFSRLGSVLNFFLTEHIAEAFGLMWTLWTGAILCGFGFLSAIVVSGLDRNGVKKLGLESTIKVNSRRLKFSQIRYFSLSFWLLCLTIMFFYNGIFPFVADASKFIQDKYDYSEATSSYMAGAVYDVSMVLSPFLGGIIDVFGKRGYLAIACSILTIPVFGLLAFTTVTPLFSTIWLGVTYSVAAASMWPSIPLVVSQSTVGTAMGLTTSIQMIGIGISNLVVGHILGDHQQSTYDVMLGWKYVMIYLLSNTLACTLVAFLLNVVDKKQDGVLNYSFKQYRLLVTQRTHSEETASCEPSEEASGSDHDRLLPPVARDAASPTT